MRNAQQRAVPLPTTPSASPQADLKRRRFLLALGAGGAATAAASAQAITAPAAGVATAPQAKARPGYRETDHVRTYYATTRI